MGRTTRRTSAATLLLALVAAGCTPGGSPADDTDEELAERLSTTAGVVDVDFEPATGESDSGEPGDPAELEVEMEPDASAEELVGVLDAVEAQGEIPDVGVSLGPDGPGVLDVDEGAPTERGAEVLLAAAVLARERSVDPAGVTVSLARPEADAIGTPRPGPFEPSLSMTVPDGDVGAVTTLAEDLAADPTYDGVRVALWATPPGSSTPSLTTGEAGMTPAVLDAWADVRSAAGLAPEGTTLLPGLAGGRTDGTRRVAAGLVLADDPDEAEVTAARYGAALQPALCALTDLVREGPPGSEVTLARDGTVLGDVAVGGEDAGAFGRPGWNRLLRGCLAS